MEQAVSILKSSLPANDPEIARKTEKLAGLYQATGRSEKAEPLLKQTMDIYKKALGDEHPSVAQVQNNLGEY
jgi:Tfp pilus assembly protein PilF